MSKYKAVKTTVDGITFDSKKEAKRYGELKLLEKAGQISHLRLQHKWPLEINGFLICTYKCDFYYHEHFKDGGWDEVVEDVKGMKTPIYKLKKKLMKAIHGIEILES